MIVTFRYKQPSTVTTTGELDVPIGLLAPGKESELKHYIVIEASGRYKNVKQSIDYHEYPETVEISLTEIRTLK